MAGWKEKMLSKAGKEILIKALALAILTYTMSCFKMSDSLCDELTCMIRNFWWGKNRRKRKWLGSASIRCANQRHVIDWALRA